MKYTVKNNLVFAFPETEEAYKEQRMKQKITDRTIEKLRMILFVIISISLIGVFVGCLLGKYERASEIIITVFVVLLIIGALLSRYLLKKSTYYLYIKAYENRIEIEQILYKATYKQKAIIYYDDVIRASLCSKGKKFKILFNNDSDSCVKNYDKNGNENPIATYVANNIMFNVQKRSRLQGF